jgi:hypothetical protein
VPGDEPAERRKQLRARGDEAERGTHADEVFDLPRGKTAALDEVRPANLARPACYR